MRPNNFTTYQFLHYYILPSIEYGPKNIDPLICENGKTNCRKVKYLSQDVLQVSVEKNKNFLHRMYFGINHAYKLCATRWSINLQNHRKFVKLVSC